MTMRHTPRITLRRAIVMATLLFGAFAPTGAPGAAATLAYDTSPGSAQPAPPRP
jgi:hypothetical protein